MRAPYGQARAVFLVLAALETDDCIPWPYSVNSDGYGQVAFLTGVTVNTHRQALSQRQMPPSRSHHAAHSCGNRRNAEPSPDRGGHLENVRLSTPVVDGWCPPYDWANDLDLA